MKIKGIPVGTTMPRPDWNQDNPKKADYIHNKPTIPRPDWNQDDPNNADYIQHKPTLVGKLTNNGGEIFNVYEETNAMGMTIPRNHASFGAHAEGAGTQANAMASHSEGFFTTVGSSANTAHAEGDRTVVQGIAGHAEGSETKALDNQTHAEGLKTIAEGRNSHAQGWGTHAIGVASHAGGRDTIASGTNSFATGFETEAQGGASFASGSADSVSGRKTIAGGYASIALGQGVQTKGENETDGIAAVAMGHNTTATGYAAMAVNDSTVASGNNSFAAGVGTKATKASQAVFGRYNKPSDTALLIVGNGTATNPSNALVANEDGSIVVSGKCYGDTFPTNAVAGQIFFKKV